MRPAALLAGLLLLALPVFAKEPSAPVAQKKKVVQETEEDARRREARAILQLQSQFGLSPEKQAEVAMRAERLVQSLGLLRTDGLTGAVSADLVPIPEELQVFTQYSRSQEAKRSWVPEPYQNIVQEAGYKAALFYRGQAEKHQWAAADGQSFFPKLSHYAAGLGAYAAAMRMSAASFGGPQVLKEYGERELARAQKKLAEAKALRAEADWLKSLRLFWTEERKLSKEVKKRAKVLENTADDWADYGLEHPMAMETAERLGLETRMVERLDFPSRNLAASYARLRAEAPKMRGLLEKTLEAGEAAYVGVDVGAGRHAITVLGVGENAARRKFAAYYDSNPGEVLTIPWDQLMPEYIMVIKAP